MPDDLKESETEVESIDPTPPEVPEHAWYWIKDTKGNPSVSVTFATVAFWVTTFSFIISIVERIGPVSIRQFDVASCSAYLIPVLTLYFGRRATDAKYFSNK